MRLSHVEIENFRAIRRLKLSLDRSLTVLHGDNALGKTSVLAAVAAGLAGLAELFPEISGNIWAETDIRHNAEYASVRLEAEDGLGWTSAFSGLKKRGKAGKDKSDVKDAANWIKGVNWEQEGDAPPGELPIFAYYDTERAVLELPQRRRNFQTEFVRFGALDGALAAKTDFHTLFEWFHAKENDELREQRDRGDFQFAISELEAVRRAIISMIPGAAAPRVETNPLRFTVAFNKQPGGSLERFSLTELSGGYRIMLAVAADLARRMAQGNPHLADPLQSEAIALIDEVDLHLHPQWQQRVLADLQRTFPNTQFIVSTHSPQVLSTVHARHILRLGRENGDVSIHSPSSSTFGAESGDIMETEMSVSQRPVNEFTQKLEQYLTIIDNDDYDSQEAIGLRSYLDGVSPRDPDLDRADIMIRHRRMLKSMEQK